MNDTDRSPGACTPTGNAQCAPPERSGLNLDARQRAMLEEMGVRVWWPGAVPESGAAAPVPAPAPVVHPARAPFTGHADRTPANAPRAAPMAAPVATHTPGMRPLPAAAARTSTPAVSPQASAVSLQGASSAPGTWTLQAPQPLFPHADPQHTPVALGSSWLVVVEGRAGSDPLAGDAGRLLENMLRALQLHRHPRAFVCLLDAAPPAGDAAALAGSGSTLESAMAAVQPVVVLLLGRNVARALLGRSDPLGHLRAEPLQVAGVPAVVSYDAPYLLRAPPETKALVWADLCRARALAGAGAAAMAVSTTGTGAAAGGPHA